MGIPAGGPYIKIRSTAGAPFMQFHRMSGPSRGGAIRCLLLGTNVRTEMAEQPLPKWESLKNKFGIHVIS
jgi:hypothetical protein